MDNVELHKDEFSKAWKLLKTVKRTQSKKDIPDFNNIKKFLDGISKDVIGLSISEVKRDGRDTGKSTYKLRGDLKTVFKILK